MPIHFNGELAQLVRALCLHRKGLASESPIPHHLRLTGQAQETGKDTR